MDKELPVIWQRVFLAIVTLVILVASLIASYSSGFNHGFDKASYIMVKKCGENR
jgi:hypothetical protein